MDKVKFFAILIPVLIGLSFRFRILIPVAVAVVVISLVTVILYGNKKKTGSFFNNFRAKGSNKFVCLECGFNHSDNTCPRCGSKIKKYYS